MRGVRVHGPVVDPFAEAVGVEDGAEQDERAEGRVPVFEGVAGRDGVGGCVGGGGGAGGFWGGGEVCVWLRLGFWWWC